MGEMQRRKKKTLVVYLTAPIHHHLQKVNFSSRKILNCFNALVITQLTLRKKCKIPFRWTYALFLLKFLNGIFDPLNFLHCELFLSSFIQL